MRQGFNNKQETGNPDRVGASRKLETGEFFVRLKFKVYSFKFSSGQSLIEVLIAFTVSVVIGMALVSAGLATQRASISARNKSQATKLAQEYLEEVRLMRDVKGFPGYSPLQHACWRINTNSSTDPSSWVIGPNPIYLSSVACQWNTPNTAALFGDEKVTYNNTDFYRRLVLLQIPPGDPTSVSTRVTAKVMWKEGTNNRVVNAETVLSKWCEGSVTGTPVAGVCP